MITAYAPGRVNLIGDHTDYAGGLVLPMAIDRGITVTFHEGGGALDFATELDDAGDWQRYVQAVAGAVDPTKTGTGRITSNLPAGAGLSSSAALEIAVALALGACSEPLALARLCQRAELEATGVPCGIMDQLVIAAAIPGHALLIDCGALRWSPVPIPADAAIAVVHSGQPRAVQHTAYAVRRAELEAGHARRVRHVRTENERVVAFADALRAGDLGAAGARMVESHRSLRDDYEVSTAVLDELVERLCATPGVYGARLSGAGFGGCVVALTDPRILDDHEVRASAAAAVSAS